MEDIQSVKNKLRFSIIGFVVVVVLMTVGFIYLSISLRLDRAIDRQQFESLITDQESLNKYYQDQEGFEAHFVTAANVIKEDQINSILQDMLIYLVPVIIIAAIYSFYLSRKLISPIQESYDSKKRFMQDASHELRNPLGAIDATTQTILEDEKLSMGIKKSLQSIQRQVKHLITLSNDLIFLEKLEATEKHDVDVNEVAMDVIDQLTHLANQHNVKMLLLSKKSAHFDANIEDMVVLMRNLISNSIKYSKDEGGEVKVNVISTKRSLMIDVEDKGIGIKDEDLEKLGERFFRASNSHDAVGSGLGLSIVQKIVQKYKGKLNIESELGVGTKIMIKMYN